MPKRRTFDKGLTLIASLVGLVNSGRMQLGHLLSYLYDSNKPLTYFGKTIDSLDLFGAKKYFFLSLENKERVINDLYIKSLPLFKNAKMYSEKVDYLKASI
jgi:hypothetical protein